LTTCTNGSTKGGSTVRGESLGKGLGNGKKGKNYFGGGGGLLHNIWKRKEREKKGGMCGGTTSIGNRLRTGIWGLSTGKTRKGGEREGAAEGGGQHLLKEGSRVTIAGGQGKETAEGGKSYVRVRSQGGWGTKEAVKKNQKMVAVKTESRGEGGNRKEGGTLKWTSKGGRSLIKREPSLG